MVAHVRENCFASYLKSSGKLVSVMTACCPYRSISDISGLLVVWTRLCFINEHSSSDTFAHYRPKQVHRGLHLLLSHV